MHNWKVGDRAITCNFHIPEYNGREVYIVSLRSFRRASWFLVDGDHPRGPLHPEQRGWVINPINLRPIDDDKKDTQRDDMKKVPWDTLEDIWQPKELERIDA